MSFWNPAVEYGAPRPAMRRVWWVLWGAFACLALYVQLAGTLQTYTRRAALVSTTEGMPGWWWIVDWIVNPLIGAVAAMLCLSASALLMWRRSDCSFFILLAFGVVSLVFVDSQAGKALEGSNWEPIVYSICLLGLSVLLMVFPAFPDGHYRPEWARWLRLTPWLFAAAFFVAMGWPWALLALPLLIFVQIGLSTFATFRRYRTTGERRERQQLKWAAFGFVFGLPLLISPLAAQFFPPPTTPAVAVMLELALVLTTSAGQILIPLGVLLSLLAVRLNDADVAIGRSAGYGLITILVGGMWAASTTWINQLFRDQLSDHTAAGVSALLAAALFIPVRDRVLAWTEKKIHPALVRLRGLPAKINPLMHDHSPNDLAVGALAAIAQGVQASRAALVATTPGGPQLLATYHCDEEAVIADLARDPDADDEFPLHIPLVDLFGEVGVLLVGRRTDGASFTGDQRAALRLVQAPLAEALRATSRRATRNAALAAAVAAIETRLARLEGLEPEPTVVALADPPTVGRGKAGARRAPPLRATRS